MTLCAVCNAQPVYAHGRCTRCYVAYYREVDGVPPDGSSGSVRGGRVTVAKYGAQHMADIGRLGGLAVSANREHMARIGRRGGRRARQRGAGE